jgi:hypothetical protein
VGANFVKLVITFSFFLGCKHNCEAKVEEKEKIGYEEEEKIIKVDKEKNEGKKMKVKKRRG